MNSPDHFPPEPSDCPESPAPCGSAAGRPRASDLENRTASLVHTAAELFIKHSYNKVSLEMIAREAHVAVRTIYVKFGGKAGLLKAVLEANRARFFDMVELENDTRPIRQVLDEFGVHLYELLNKPEAVSMQRMVIADAPGNGELVRTFYDSGPLQTQLMLARYFARPDIRAQLHPEASVEALPLFLVNTIAGNAFERLLFIATDKPWEQHLRELAARLALFYRAALRET